MTWRDCLFHVVEKKTKPCLVFGGQATVDDLINPRTDSEPTRLEDYPIGENFTHFELCQHDGGLYISRYACINVLKRPSAHLRKIDNGRVKLISADSGISVRYIDPDRLNEMLVVER